MSRPESAAPDYSYEFYRRHSARYAQWWSDHSDITQPSHPTLTDFSALTDRLTELVPPESRGVDAGCGPSGKELTRLLGRGYEVIGIDAVEENLQTALSNNPELEGRLFQADLGNPLSFSNSYFDFVICTTVIQHIAPEQVMGVTLPEFVRVLKPDGVLQLTFKYGHGIITVYDPVYDLDRTFQLYGIDEVLEKLGGLGMEVVPEEREKLGGIMYYVDTKGVKTCSLFARKNG